MQTQTSRYGTSPSVAARPRRSAYWPATVPEAALRTQAPTPQFRAAIWLTIIFVSGLTFWLARPVESTAVEYPPIFHKVSPSDWAEQTRATSPDGKLDAVVVVADDGEHLRPVSELEEGLGQSPEESKPRQILCVRLVAAGEKVVRERPYFGAVSEFHDKAAADSVFASSPNPDLNVRWESDEVLLLSQASPDSAARLAKALTTVEGKTRWVKIRYQP